MPLIPGTRIGSYEVTAPLGAGGMGEVYRAIDAKLKREVALKVLPSSVAGDAERLARFQREAEVLARLNHPHIAQIYGLEESEAGTALVMELVEGPTLADRIARGPVPVGEALPIARQIADALEAAHEQGIVHRDLKPANIKVRHDGAVKVLDFGLAKAVQEPKTSGAHDRADSPTITSPAMTAAGIVLGTPAYMSPEQAKGKPADRRADIWAFGAVLFEMLSGQRAFAGEDVADTLAQVLTREVDVTALPATTPLAVRQVLRRCLERNPKNRLHDIADARIVLDEVLAGTTGDDSGGDASTTRARSSTFKVALPWMAGSALGMLLGVLVMQGLGLRRPPESMQFRAITNFAGVQAQPALSPDGRSVAFVSDRDGDFNIYLGLVGGGSLVRVTEGSSVKATPRWSPDGTLLAYASLNEWGLWDVWQIPALGGTPRRLLENAADPAWSADGRSLAYANLETRTIWMADANGQNPRELTHLPNDTVGRRDGEPRFSPDGRSLAFVSRPGGPYGELMLLDLASGDVRELTHDGALAQSPAWSPDGLHVYFASSRNGTMNVWRVSARGGSPEPVTTGQGDDAQLDVSADGRRIVFATFREKLSIFQSDIGRGADRASATRLATDPARNQLDPVYSPSGEHLAYFSNLKGVEREGIWSAGADGAVQLVQDARLNIFPRWSADGERLLYFSTLPTQQVSVGQYRRVSRSGGAPETLLEGVVDENFDVGADGRLLFYGPQGTLQSYDPGSRARQTLAASPLSARGWLPRWSSDLRSVTYLVRPRHQGDADAGLWIEELGSPPRQLFHGWVLWYSRGTGDQIVLHQGKADLNGVLWRVGVNGGAPERLSTLRLLHSPVNGPSGPRPPDFFDVSTDGRRLAFIAHDVLQANLSMLERAGTRP